MQEKQQMGVWFNAWAKKVPWRSKWQPTPIFWILKNPMDREAWWVIVHGIAKSWT